MKTVATKPPAFRVLYIHPYMNRKDRIDHTRTRDLIAEFEAAGAEVVTLYALTHDERGVRPAKIDLPGATRRLIAGFFPASWTPRIWEIQLFIRRLVEAAVGCWRAWRTRGDLRPDVVLGRVTQFDWTPWLVAKVLGCPCVLEIHSAFYVERRLRQVPPGGRESRVLRWFEIVQWRYAKGLWVNSPRLSELMVDNGVRPDRVAVIPSGVVTDRFSGGTRRAVDGATRIVFVGSFYSWHGVELLIEAFAKSRRRVPSLMLRLVGDGATRSACEKAARSLAIESAVSFTGWLPYHKVVEELFHADIAVAPYLKLEPFYFDPFKITEYMASGLAVIASDQDHISSQIVHGETGILVPPNDEAALSQALVDLARDPDLRARLGAAARAKVMAEFRLEQSVRRVLALCKEAASTT